MSLNWNYVEASKSVGSRRLFGCAQSLSWLWTTVLSELCRFGPGTCESIALTDASTCVRSAQTAGLPSA
jgi:hypothetical protein